MYTRTETTKQQWLALAERCEAATGPDREITESIMHALGYSRVSDAHWFCEGKGHWNDGNRLAASLDAITALIEREFPETRWSVAHSGYSWPDTFAGQISPVGGLLMRRLSQSATPALALCAAFCRAKAERAGAP